MRHLTGFLPSATLGRMNGTVSILEASITSDVTPDAHPRTAGREFEALHAIRKL